MSRMVKDLSNEKWQCEHIRPGGGIAEEWPKIPCERQGAAFNWNYVHVPGDVYTDLQRVGEIDDPYFGQNMHKNKWIQEQEYWYMCKFNLDDEMTGKHVRLDFEGVDYSCEVWFNGHYLGAHEGMFSGFEFDITQFANYENWVMGSNILLIKLDPPPRNFERVSGMKANYNGDYHTGIVPFGIWRPVKIVATERIYIEDLRIESYVNGPDAKVTVDYDLNSLMLGKHNMEVVVKLDGVNCDTETIEKLVSKTVVIGENKMSLEFDLKKANLWWPWDMGQQNLHTITIELSKEGVIYDRVVERFGIRQIEMTMNPGYTKEESSNPWTFNVNGKRTYLRAACWGGQPSMLYGKNNYSKYEHLLNMVKESNVNHLRIFGWHVPEIPDFYNLCDELGITVWTNFTYSTNVVRKELPYKDQMVNECMEIVKDRRNHPSAIYWMGGEEVFFTDAHAQCGNKELLEAIGEEIKKFTNTPYGIASPLSNETGIEMGFGTKESQHANEHYYGAGHVFMEDYYPKLDCCIVPELTAASAPSVESLKRFIPENELWPMGMSWAYHYADIDVLKILNIEALGDVRMGSLEEFVAATQETHAIVLQYALEFYRRRKPYNSGVAFCHFITHWPDIKWGIVDYYGKKKNCFTQVQKTFAPLLVSLEHSKRRWNPGETFDGKLWVVNDLDQTFENITGNYKIYNDNGQLITEGSQSGMTIQADSAEGFINIDLSIPEGDHFMVALTLTNAEGRVIAENTYRLIVGDQDEAKAELKKMRVEADERRDLYPGFYRYFPEQLEQFMW